MSDYPDYSPPPNYAYPPTPASYVQLHFAGQLTSGSAQTLASLTDSKLYALKYLRASGTVTNTSTTNTGFIDFDIALNQGLANTGSSFTLLGGFWRFPKSGVTGENASFVYDLFLDGPLIFKAGTVGTPQALSVSYAFTTADAEVTTRVSGVCWPLN